MGHRILVAIDDSPSAVTTLDYASALARKDDAEVHVLHVNLRLPAGRGHYRLTSAEADDLVQAALDQLAALGVTAIGVVARANVLDLARAVVDEADSRGCDQIIVGSDRRRGLRRLVGHGVRERLVRLSHLPVTTAPAPLRLVDRPGSRWRPATAEPGEGSGDPGSGHLDQIRIGRRR